MEILFDLDEFVVIMLAVAGALSIFFVIWYVVSAIVLAPEVLAEIFLDGVFCAALYRRLGSVLKLR